MLCAILADDEAVILKGLKKLIDWEKMGIQVVGEAGNGKEALELIQDKKPDLAVSDIAMPELDGLDMLREINRLGLGTKVIFISGYQEFSYAKKAVTYGAVDYILKPVERDELEAAIQKAAGLIDERCRLSILDTEKEENELSRIFHQINGNQEYARQDLYEQFEALNIDVAHKEFTGAAFRLYFTRSGPASIKMQELQKFSAYNRLRKKLEEEKWGFVIKKDLNTCYVIFTLSPEEDERVIRIRVRKLQAAMTGGQPNVVKTGVGERLEEISALQLAYKTSRFALELYYFTEEDEIWHYRENLTLESMADFASMNLYYFSSYFKKNTGENFKNYLTDIRMKEAAKLLKNTDYKAYEVAEAVGYKNVRQFNENFKGKYGHSPNEYRKGSGTKGE